MISLPLLNLASKIASLVGIVAIFAAVGSLIAFASMYDSSSAGDVFTASMCLVAAPIWAAIAVIAIIARQFILTAMREIGAMITEGAA